MILSGDEIRNNLGKDIVIEPFCEDNLNPNSYNLSLHDELMVYEEVVLDMCKPNRVRRMEIPPEGLVLAPNQLYLGRTCERTARPGTSCAAGTGKHIVGPRHWMSPCPSWRAGY